MKKVIALLSFVFVLGLISVNAQDAAKKPAKKAPAAAKKATKKVAPAKK